MLETLAQFLPFLGIISVIFFGIQAIKFEGEFTNQVILKYSAIYASSLSLPILILLLTGGVATLQDNGFPFLMIVVASTGLFYLHWKFYRYIASKAEAAGRSYGAFLVLAILFGFFTLLVVSLFKPENAVHENTRSNKNSSNTSLDVQLANLQNLKDQGVLTEEEFIRAKAKLIL